MKPTPRGSKKQLASGMLVSSKLISSQSKTAAPSEANLARRESRYVSGDIGDGDQDEAWLQPKVWERKYPNSFELSYHSILNNLVSGNTVI